jgi:xylulokinase
LTCFANGSLARERVRDGFGLSWTQFSQALCDTPPGNGDRLMLPWFDPEITPHVPEPRVRRDRLDERDVAGNIRAVIEAQMMAMANHSAWMGAAGSTTREITATGGASVNREVLQIMADVFGADVRRLDVPHSAALGAALRARHASMIAAGTPEDWHAIVSPFTRPTSATRIVPRAVASERYDVVRGRYAIFEELSRAENSSAANRRPPSSHR